MHKWQVPQDGTPHHNLQTSLPPCRQTTQGEHPQKNSVFTCMGPLTHTHHRRQGRRHQPNVAMDVKAWRVFRAASPHEKCNCSEPVHDKRRLAHLRSLTLWLQRMLCPPQTRTTLSSVSNSLCNDLKPNRCQMRTETSSTSWSKPRSSFISCSKLGR